jgi:hypothetical protein
LTACSTSQQRRQRGADDQPIAGVAVSLLGHPEYGETLTQANGLFDLAVNGGEMLTLRYEKRDTSPLSARCAPRRTASCAPRTPCFSAMILRSPKWI